MIQFSLFLAQAEPTAVNGLAAIWERIYEANVLNLVLVVIFLWWLCKKYNVFAGIEDKLNSTKFRITDAEEDKHKSEQELDTTKGQIADSDTVIRKIKTEAEDIAGNLSKAIISEIAVEAESMEKNSERIIQGEKEMAALQLSNKLTKTAFGIAEEHIKQSIDDRLHKKYINEFIDSLDNLKV